MALAYYGFILLGVGMAALFQVLFVKSRRPLMLICSVLWLLPICYETWVLSNCTGECNIRVDVVYLFPIEVIVLTTLSVFAWIAYRKRLPKG